MKDKLMAEHLSGALDHLRKLLDEGEPDPEWHEAFDAWFAERYPEDRWGSTKLAYAWMKHSALSAILWTSGMLPEDDKVFEDK
jgi:hypothetical protein